MIVNECVNEWKGDCESDVDIVTANPVDGSIINSCLIAVAILITIRIIVNHNINERIEIVAIERVNELVEL